MALFNSLRVRRPCPRVPLRRLGRDGTTVAAACPASGASLAGEPAAVPAWPRLGKGVAGLARRLSASASSSAPSTRTDGIVAASASCLTRSVRPRRADTGALGLLWLRLCGLAERAREAAVERLATCLADVRGLARVFGRPARR